MCSQLSQVWPTGSRFLEAWITLIYEIVVLMLSSAIMIFCYSCSMDQLWRGAQGFKKQKAFKIIMAAIAVFFLCWTLYNITRWKHFILTQATKLVQSQHLILYAFVGVEFRYRLLSIPRSLCSGQSDPPSPSLMSNKSYQVYKTDMNGHIHCMFVYFLCYITWKKKWLLCFLYVTLHLLAV